MQLCNNGRSEGTIRATNNQLANKFYEFVLSSTVLSHT